VWACSLSYPEGKELQQHYIFTSGLSGSKINFHLISKTAGLSENGIEDKMCVLILSTILSKTFLIQRRI
jgi:hypothetical protein